MKMRMTRIILVFLLAWAPLTQVFPDDISSAASKPKEEETLFMAKKALEDGFYEVSLGLLERFLNNYPDSPSVIEANLLVGECYFHQNKFMDALLKFEMLLKDSRSKNIRDALYYWIAEVNFKGNNFNQAILNYKKIIREFPASSYVPVAYYSLGWCLFQEQKFKSALEYFRALAEKYPKEPQSKDALFKIIECLYSLKDYTGLKNRISPSIAALAKDPLRLAYLYFYLGEANYYLGNFEEALAAYAKVLGLNPDEKMQALCKLDLAWSYLKLKRYKEAEDVFWSLKQEDLEKRSRDILLLGKALLFMETNRINEAIKLYEELLALTNDPLISAQGSIGRADALYNLADYSLASGAYKDALAKINLKDMPAQAVDKLRYNLGWSLFKQGDTKGAIKEFQKVVDSSADTTLKLSALCQIGDAYQEGADFKGSEEAYSLLLKEYPGSAYSDYALYQLGAVFLKDSQTDQAILNLANLVKSFPESQFFDDAVYTLGLAYFNAQDYNSAKNTLKKFLLELKDSGLKPKALYLLGNCYYNLGDYSSAIQTFKEVTKLSGSQVQLAQKAEYGVADSLYQAGEEKEALARFKALRSKYPDSAFTPEIIWWLGSFYYQHAEPDLAARYFSSLIRDFSGSYLLADAYYALGLVFAEESKNKEALESFQKALDLNKPEILPKASLAIADIYTLEGKFDLALDLYKDVARNYPNLSDSISLKIAEGLAKKGDYNAALDYYRNGLKGVALKDAQKLHFKVAEIQEERGNIDDAIKEYLEAVNSAQQDNVLTAEALFRLGQIYEDRDNSPEALSIYKKILQMNIAESGSAQERINRIEAAAK